MANSIRPSLRRPTGHRFAKYSLLLLAFALLWALSAWRLINHSARDRTYTAAASVPPRQVGLVLGCARQLANGRANAFFDNRILAAAQLYRAGKVRYLLVSGDKHGTGYDEPRDMKESLMAAGVPAERIYCDESGFTTRDSVLRARWIFGQTRLTIISQEFHNQRAIWLARQHGIDAIGFTAPEVASYGSFLTRCREVAARANLMLDVIGLRSTPKPTGQKLPIPP
ncbi:ElyC/SanA/YdcF family protein [uncultured Paludibaculum sp.]|uniref:SanA/YdcF family protein n=1 Tax=uncultured Paludibaculum sp. TaxID=1765020 RepID=UPI002AABF7B9|nr:ElyC/SanA/YdcF family protein [uncultured Paludibaculum sp.]